MHFAYLIMAHENSFCLNTLMKVIDHEQNDIFIHFDAKVDLNFEKELRSLVKKSSLFILQERVAVKWANISQVEAEYLLFENAFLKRKYNYYHLLSGSDIPIKSQQYIYNFLSIHNGREFIAFANDAQPDRIKFIHLFSERFRSLSPIEKQVQKSFIFLQKIFQYSRIPKQKEWVNKKGTNWASVTDSFVKHLLDNKQSILNLMKYAKSPDEHYKQVLAYNSEFRNHLYSVDDEFEGCMRLIDWTRGKPYEWQVSDVNEILSSNKLFARKFTDKNEALIKLIERHLGDD